SGGIPQSVKLIEQAPVNAVDETKARHAMFRDQTKQAPHNLYGRGPDLLHFDAKPIPIPPLFAFGRPTAKFPGEPVRAFTVKFNPAYAPTYTFDATSATWKRAIGGVAFTAASGGQ